ncbi:hypothetical protein TNCV_3501401 [Trichonephila clavipes]|uniref:Transposase Tc1-like domain-containing protein n=1 Tax=Trichonephila clavipes TaxID=2585209 RepID=A0A8X6V2J9_TRICX|nr:hypothetical protein TNCV_3501401 [Trichonephila clavipes]
MARNPQQMDIKLIPALEYYIVKSNGRGSRVARRNRTENATQLQRQLLLATGRRVPSQTVRNRLHEGGLYARRPMVCIPLTPRHRAARRRWAAEH